MQPTDRTEFVRILTGLATIKPNGKLTPEALDLWWNAMQHWGIDDFRSAASHLISSVEFMPSPFHFEQLRQAGRMTAGEAWGRVVAHARAGRYRTESLAADIERGVQAIGGWRAIAMSDESQLPFIERRFAEHFDAIRDAHDVRAAVPQLACPASPNLLERQP